MELDRGKYAAPLYIQIENIIKEKIENGEYGFGDVLPSEKQLQEMFDVSRVTVRQAVSNLVNEGYLKSSRGIGTTVVFEKIDEMLKRVISFSEEMRLHGMKMDTSYCYISQVDAATKFLAGKLGVSEGEPYYQLDRVRRVKGAPMVYSTTYLAKRYDIPLDSTLYNDSLYKFLEQQFGVKITNGQDTFEATLANEKIGKFLEIPEGAPVFKRTRRTLDQHDNVVEYTICYYPGDKYKYSVDL